MKKLYALLGLTLVLMFCGCQQEIELDLPDYQSKLVVEGTIENGQPAMVMLSKSIPYFSEINLNTLMSEVLVDGTKARVFVTSETGETEELRWQLSPDAPYYMAFIGSKVLGKEQTHYTLTVEYGGKTYTAVTYIPKTFDLDSIGFDHSAEVLADTMATIRVAMTDPADEENFYAFYCKVNCPTLHDRLWVCGMPVAFNDLVFNGMTFNYEISRYGYSVLMSGLLSEEDQQSFRRITFRPGDTVYVKHTQIDRHTCQYLMTAGAEAAYGSNPFLNPSPVESNFDSDEVLGHWSGFAAKVDTLVWRIEPAGKREQ